MATNPNWPLTVTSVALSTDPFDGAATPSYVDISARVIEFEAAAGRQYELDQMQAGEASLTVTDRDETFNPTNPSSAHYPYVLPYRQLLDQAMWPPTPAGSAVNLLPGQVSPALDPSFESYSNGQSLSWVLSIGAGVSPTVTTTNPQQGTKSLTYAVTAGGGTNGVGLTVTTIPGQQYLGSLYVRQTAANTTLLFIDGGAAGTSTTTTGSYVRLSVAFTATRPSHELWVASLTTGSSGTVNVDAIQVETTAPLNATPTFGGSIGGWIGVNGATISQTTAPGQIGLGSMLVTPNGSTAVPQALSEEVAVTAGTSYALYGRIKSTQAGTRTLNIFWYNSSHVFLSSSAISQSLTAGVWTAYGTSIFTAPGGAAFARVVSNDPGTPTAANTWLVDTAMLLPTVPATFSAAAGQVIYGNFAGYVERWPSAWNHQGMYGMASITAVDGFAILAGQFLGTEIRNAILEKAPVYYWPLSEPEGTTSFVEYSGNGGPPLTRLDGPFGPGPTFAAGTQSNVAGDPSGTGLACSTNGVSTNVPASVAQAGLKIGSTPISFGGSATFSWSAGFILSRTTPITPGGQSEFAITLTQATNFPRVALFQFYTDSIPSVVNVNVQAPGLVGASINVAPDIWADGHPHLYVLTGSISATTVTVNLWIDGALYDTASNGSVSGYTSPLIMDVVEVGGYLSPKTQTPGAAVTAGVYSHVALWNRVLSSSEIADLNYAFGGYVNEGSGARVTRYLRYNWTGGTSIAAGATTMGVSDLAAGTSVLDAVLNVTQAENGVAFVDGTGTINFQARTSRYLTTTAAWTFGEAESPYEGNITYDYDPTLVQNDPQVTRSGGVTAVGGALADRQASWKKYGKRSYAITINVASDLETQDRANWVFYTHQDPLQRVAALTLKPSANPALWPVCLGVEIGDRATVKRRTAGYTMSADYFIERIEQHRSPTEWSFTLQMSPAAATGQPWILGDATYGQLGTTTVLGY